MSLSNGALRMLAEIELGQHEHRQRSSRADRGKIALEAFRTEVRSERSHYEHYVYIGGDDLLLRASSGGLARQDSSALQDICDGCQLATRVMMHEHPIADCRPTLAGVAQLASRHGGDWATFTHDLPGFRVGGGDPGGGELAVCFIDLIAEELRPAQLVEGKTFFIVRIRKWGRRRDAPGRTQGWRPRWPPSLRRKLASRDADAPTRKRQRSTRESGEEAYAADREATWSVSCTIIGTPPSAPPGKREDGNGGPESQIAAPATRQSLWQPAWLQGPAELVDRACYRPAMSVHPGDGYDDQSKTVQQLGQNVQASSCGFLVRVDEGLDQGIELVVEPSTPARLLVGTSPACALRLTDTSVSRRHVALEMRSGQLVVTDLGSTNGTFLGDVQLGEARIGAAASIRIGGSRLSLRPLAPTSSTAQLPTKIAFGPLLGASAAMRRLYPLCERLGRTDLAVIIEGETGTGKEVLANALHQMGPRARQPFIVFDCTAVPPNLVEALLFGHERGAFTGATEMRQGVFERANGGTLLIDEIGDLDLALQPKLLGVLERSAVQRVGSTKLHAVDVRVIAATRRDLDREVQAGRFRDDLYHRLAVARIELPPLRHRREDIPVLVRHFLRGQDAADAVVSPSQMNRWLDHDWPGNVRELRNAVARQVALGDLGAEGILPYAAAEVEEQLHQARNDDDDWIDEILQSELPLAQARRRVIDEFERRYVERLMSQHGGSVKDAAAAAGVAKRYFQLVKARSGRGR